MLGHLLRVFCKSRSFSRRQVIHPDPVTFDADLLQQLMDVIDTFPAPEIALVIMAVALQAADAENPVGAFLETSEEVHHIHFAGTGDTDYFDVRGVRQSHRTCQVRGGVPSVVATKSYDSRFEISHYIPPASRVSISQVI